MFRKKSNLTTSNVMSKDNANKLTHNASNHTHHEEEEKDEGQRKINNGTDKAPPVDKKCFLNSTAVPWKTMSYSKDFVGLKMEILDFFQFFGPMQLDEVIRSDVVERVATAVKSRLPKCIVDTFGSSKTGLFLPYSDIDIVIFGDFPLNPLDEVVNALRESKMCVDNEIVCLNRASIPVIKFRDVLTLTPVDICFNIYNANKYVALVNNFITTYPNISPLFLLLKEIICERNLNCVYTGGLPSYALFLMLVSFFQLHPRSDACTANANLGELLLEFFKLFGCDFNYETTGIRIKNGGSHVAKNTLRLGDGNVPSALYIEDPLVAGSDVAKNTYQAIKIQQTFQECFQILNDSLNHLDVAESDDSQFSFLRKIINIPSTYMDAKRRYENLNKMPEFIAQAASYSSSPYAFRHSFYSSIIHSQRAWSLVNNRMAYPMMTFPLSIEVNNAHNHLNDSRQNGIDQNFRIHSDIKDNNKPRPNSCNIVPDNSVHRKNSRNDGDISTASTCSGSVSEPRTISNLE